MTIIISITQDIRDQIKQFLSQNYSYVMMAAKHYYEKHDHNDSFNMKYHIRDQRLPWTFKVSYTACVLPCAYGNEGITNCDPDLGIGCENCDNGYFHDYFAEVVYENKTLNPPVRISIFSHNFNNYGKSEIEGKIELLNTIDGMEGNIFMCGSLYNYRCFNREKRTTRCNTQLNNRDDVCNDCSRREADRRLKKRMSSKSRASHAA